MAQVKIDIHQQITDKFIAALEAGTRPWSKDWTGGRGFEMPLRVTGEAYQGINVLLLWMASEENGFSAPTFMTFQQAKKLGGMVRKGSKGTTVVFASAFEKENDAGKIEKIPFLKKYTVFNIQQIDGLPEKWDWTEADEIDTGARPIVDIEAFFAATGATIHNDGINPCYKPGSDSIHMPTVQHFKNAHEYYGTLAHELIHWTGAPSRLDRDKKYDTTAGRALEELIAEIGSVFLSHHIGATPDFDNSAAYVASWLKALKDDKRFIFRAASAAQKASNYALDCASHDTHAIAAE
tara:strand:+ start:42219 stop:43100 length:882 start_codon:yes stop_codon:yes gene_type:complete